MTPGTEAMATTTPRLTDRDLAFLADLFAVA